MEATALWNVMWNVDWLNVSMSPSSSDGRNLTRRQQHASTKQGNRVALSHRPENLKSKLNYCVVCHVARVVCKIVISVWVSAL